jgi:hypothetical protein
VPFHFGSACTSSADPAICFQDSEQKIIAAIAEIEVVDVIADSADQTTWNTYQCTEDWKDVHGRVFSDPADVIKQLVAADCITPQSKGAVANMFTSLLNVLLKLSTKASLPPAYETNNDIKLLIRWTKF